MLYFLHYLRHKKCVNVKTSENLLVNNEGYHFINTIKGRQASREGDPNGKRTSSSNSFITLC